MKYAHGQHAAYVLDKCHCEPCRLSNRRYEQERAQRVEPAYVIADPARKHMEWLASIGIGRKSVAAITGLPHGTLSKLVYGDPARRMGPSRRVRKATHDKIMSVTPSMALGGTRVPVGPTWGLLEQMIAAGVPKMRIAQAAGLGTSIQLKRTEVLKRNADAVRDLHARWMTGDIVFERRDSWGHRTPIIPPAPARREFDPTIGELYLDLAEIVEDRNDEEWRRSSACRNRPTWIWFPARGDVKTLAKAKRICSACTVRGTCLSVNLHRRDGVYGGLSGKERRELRRIELAVA